MFNFVLAHAYILSYTIDMKKVFLIICCFSLVLPFAFSQTAQEVFEKVNNTGRNFSTMSFEAEMEIFSRGRTLTKEFYGYLDDSLNASFMEYTNAQDYGTRYLKLENDMWIYIPDAGDVLKLSGHLLRDSMMGSDISYDDMSDQGSLETDYIPISITTDVFEKNEVFVLTIRAKDENTATYVKQDLYIDKSSYNILKSVMFAKGRGEDRAVKEFVMKNYIAVGNLFMPTIIEVIDLRKKDSKTVIVYNSIEVDVAFNRNVFTRAYLEQ